MGLGLVDPKDCVGARVIVTGKKGRTRVHEDTATAPWRWAGEASRRWDLCHWSWEGRKDSKEGTAEGTQRLQNAVGLEVGPAGSGQRERAGCPGVKRRRVSGKR